uniref:Ig-like domain-containing protein n=1 Tax=Astyanax mexicanus TaxID=7994 RepID=A0A3B1JZ28_ASTMX
QNMFFVCLFFTSPVSCFDVIGYSGGSVIIYCTRPQNKGYNALFCKESGTECVFLESDETKNTWDHKDRVSVDEIPGFLTLNVKSDADFLYCSYPEEIKEKPKIFFKQDFDQFIHVISTSDSQKYPSSFSETLRKRFSISEDRRSRVISVRISDVIREDDGDYYCGVSGDEGSANYETFFTKIHLCFDVIGYSGGIVMIYCTIPKNKGYNGYFCKESGKECVYLNPDKSPNSWDHKGRVSVDETPGFLTVTYRDLSLEDTGLYQCGETGEWQETLKLNMKSGQSILIIWCKISKTCPASCSNVIGYSRGSVVIYCNYQQQQGNDKYFCKESTNQCVNLKHDQIKNWWDHKGRVSVRDYPSYEVLRVFYRDLSLEDAGLYQCGETGVWSHAVKIVVKEGETELKLKFQTVTSRLGETVTISCSYPEEFKEKSKFISTLNGLDFTEMAHTSDPSRGRFSIFDNRRSRVVSMRISDVRKGDEGLYYCGVSGDRGAVSYETFFTKIHLQITGKLHSTSQLTNYGDYVSDPCRPQKNISISPVNQNNPNTNQSDSVYQSLILENRDPNSVYQTLNPNTNQSDSVYQSLNPNTNRSDSVNQSLNPNTNQSDSVYQSLILENRDPNSVYQTLNPKTNYTDLVYQSVNPNTNQSYSVYQSLNPTPTNQIQSIRV